MKGWSEKGMGKVANNDMLIQNYKIFKVYDVD